MKKPILVAFLMAGCASNSGIVPMGEDIYMVSRQAATGFTGMGTLKADAIREAGAFCRGRGKALQVISSTESKPPYILGNFPKSEVTFTCK